MQLTDKSTKLSLCLKLFEQLKMYSVLSRKFTKIMQHAWIVNTCLTHWNAFIKSKYSIQTLFNSFSLLHSCITTLPPSEPGLSSLADKSFSISPDSELFGSTCSTSPSENGATSSTHLGSTGGGVGGGVGSPMDETHQKHGKWSYYCSICHTENIVLGMKSFLIHQICIG